MLCGGKIGLRNETCTVSDSPGKRRAHCWGCECGVFGAPTSPTPYGHGPDAVAKANSELRAPRTSCFLIASFLLIGRLFPPKKRSLVIPARAL
jgi:hypothetical protein